MRKAHILFVLFAALMTTLGSSSKAEAQLSCVTNLLSGLGTEANTSRGDGLCFKNVRPMKLVVVRKTWSLDSNASWVAYSGDHNPRGEYSAFVKNASGHAVARLLAQQFSDRKRSFAGEIENNFDTTDMDSVSVTVQPNNTIVYTNHTWPGSSVTLTNATCSGNNTILASTASHLFILTYGAVENHICVF